jgi:hypothetical protein
MVSVNITPFVPSFCNHHFETSVIRKRNLRGGGRVLKMMFTE